MLRNVAPQTIHFLLLSRTDGLPMLGQVGNISDFVIIDNGTQTAGTGGLAEKGKGVYEYRIITASETDGDHVNFTFEAVGAISVSQNYYPIVVDDYKADLSNVRQYGQAEVKTHATTGDTLPQTVTKAP